MCNEWPDDELALIRIIKFIISYLTYHISLTNTKFMDFTGSCHCAVIIRAFATKQIDVLRKIKHGGND